MAVLKQRVAREAERAHHAGEKHHVPCRRVCDVVVVCVTRGVGLGAYAKTLVSWSLPTRQQRYLPPSHGQRAGRHARNGCH